MTWVTGGHKDWLSLSVGGDAFELKFNRKANPTKSFSEEADTAANLLYQEWNNKPLYLALSGGLDSEMVANTLVRNNISFTPVILKIGELNQYESWYAEHWCYRNQVTPIILNFTTAEFIKEYIKYFPKLTELKNYNQSQILFIYDYVHSKGGHCIYAAGDINLDSDRKEFYCDSLDFISNLVDPGNHPTSFFMYTPELAASYIKNFNINLTEQYNKLNFYNVAPRPKIDYVPLLYSHLEVSPTRDKLFHIFKLDQTPFKSQFWYGTKEKLLTDLCK